MFLPSFISILFIFLQLSKGSLLQEAGHDERKVCATLILIIESVEAIRIRVHLNTTQQFQHIPNPVYLNYTAFKANVTENCRLTLCNENALMGLYCYEYLHDPSGSVDIDSVAGDKEYLKFLQEAFRNTSASSACICEDDPENDAEANKFWKNDLDKDYDANRNFVGVTFSTNNDANAIGNYSESEVTKSLWLVASRFSQLSVYSHPGYEQEPIDLVLKEAAKINQKLNYLLLRISVIIVNEVEVEKVLDAIEVANEIFPGTVWGITIESSEEYITTLFLEGIQDKVRERGKIVPMFNQIKFGIRANTFYETGLCPRDIAEPADYEICVRYLTTTKPSEKFFENFHNEALIWREYLHEMGKVKKVYVEAGLPSNGTWGGSKNTVAGMQTLWKGMRKFAENNNYHVFMKEAFDQPWKKDFNAYYGWWARNPETHELEEKQPEPEIENNNGENNDEKKSGPWNWNLLFGGVALFIVAVIGVVLWNRKRKSQKYRRDLKVLANEFIKGDPTVSQMQLGENEHGNGRHYLTAVRAPYDARNEISNKDITIDKSSMRTSRDDVTVVRGSINMNNCKSSIFLKSTSPQSSLTSIKHLLSEIKIYSYLGPHVNVVGFLGAITTKIEMGVVTLALEYCPLGDLRTFLNEKVDKSELEEKYCKIMIMNTGDDIYQDVGGFTTLSYFTAEDDILDENAENQSQATFSTIGYVSDFDVKEQKSNASINKNLTSTLINIDLRQLYQWCLQIAKGLDFLSQRHIVHADLAARNCLLASIDLVKISDFGLSKRQYAEMTLVTHDTDTPLPFKWMSPESLRSLVFSSKSDAWSFGVTVWEIFTLGEMPFEEASFDQHFVNLVESGSLRLGRPKYACKELYDTMLQCWSSDPEKRPTFSELEKIFHKISSAY